MPKPVRIMPLGDSLTAAEPGYRGPLSKLFRDAKLGVEFVGNSGESPLRHEGHGGFTIGPGASQADKWADGKGNLFDNLDAWLRVKSDVILLLVGINDYLNVGDADPAYNPNRTGPTRLAGLLDKIHKLAPGAKVLVSSLLPVQFDAKFAWRFNAAIPGIVQLRPFAVFADLNKTCGWAEGDWTSDKLHPTERGYEKLAAAWFGAAKPVVVAALEG